ncbi:hypothetical protein EV687_0756 [Corticibacter populi]|nr:hypothetical protein EV687_0756 [Corticibacter populi]
MNWPVADIRCKALRWPADWASACACSTATLVLGAQGGQIDGGHGIGYQLHSGFLLPAMMFSTEKLEALVLGTRWVAVQGDPDSAGAHHHGAA